MESVRRDQIVYRFYVKTLGVLADARLEFPAAEEGEAEVRIDKWFNLPLPDYELFRSELAPYRALSGTPSSSAHGSPRQDTISTPTNIAPPPLLIAFTLDTSAIPPNEQLYLRTRGGARVAVQLDSAAASEDRDRFVSPDRAREEKERKHGVVLERWTLRCLTSSTTSVNSSSSSASYRAGIIHFRELFSYIGTLPTHELVQRLRGGQGQDQRLGIGVKVWSAEGLEGDTERALEDAWRKMEEGLLPLHAPVPYPTAFPGNRGQASPTVHHSFPPVTLGNAQFALAVEARRDVDFFVDAPSNTNSLRNSLTSSSGNMHAQQQAAYERSQEEEQEEEQEEYFTPTIRHDSVTSASPASPRRYSHFPGTQTAQNPVHLANIQPLTAGLSATRPAGPLSSPRTRAFGTFDNSEDQQTGSTSTTNATAREATRNEAAVEGGRRTTEDRHRLPPFAVSPAQGGSSGSFTTTTARYGALQSERVSSSPIPAGQIGRRYSGIGSAGGVAGSEGGSGGSFTSPRYGTLQSDRVSSSPIPALQIGRKYSGLGGGASESGVRGSPRSTSGGIGLGISRTMSSGGGGVAGTSYERPSSSYQRPSSYLSHSGRSFTQIGGGPTPAAAPGTSYGASETSRPRLQSLLSSHSATAGQSPGTPPFLGSGGSRPSSFSFSPTTTYLTNAAARSSSTRAINHHAPDTGTPPIPETHESGDDTDVPGDVGGTAAAPGTSFGAGSRSIKRYSSSFGQQQQPQTQQQQQRRGTPFGGGSTTSSGDPGSLMFVGSESRRTSARGSFDSMGMRKPSVTSLTRVHAPPTPADADDIHAFLRTLDLMAHPTSSTSDTSDSLSASRPRSGVETGKEQSSSGTSSVYRKPLTKSQVDDALKRMAGSYTPPFPLPSTSGTSLSPRLPPVFRSPGAQPSLPSTTLDRPFGTPPQASLPRHSSNVKSSSPLAGEPIRAHRVRSSLDTTASRSESTSAASAASSTRDQIVEPLTFGKTRGGYADKSSEDGGRGESRRVTVLMRGGFGQFDPPLSSRDHSSVTSVGSAPPIGSPKYQLQRRTTDREVGFHDSDRGKREFADGNTDRVTAPILSAGAQPLDQGVRSWTHRRPLGGDEGDPRLAARSTLYTAPASLESHQQRGMGNAGWSRECPSTTLSGVANRMQPRRGGRPSTGRKTSDDGDDSIVGNLEMSGA
ncbi:hypothetical protein QFC21_000687 [Naganishia friedmannii]|uniref:Uncharacterized protein n=1 Tax=Naganishia friedmannii TaxID=89922 RepID=A0ACC2WCH8_9TREE|nr:hypothetical protein QFC21_000687 [Naganishia friedmannii]